MNSPSPLINYDLLYSPEIKKDSLKSKPMYQASATSSSLSNTFKDNKNFNFLKSPNSNSKPVFPSDFTTKPLISTTHTISTAFLSNNFSEKARVSDGKLLSPQNQEKNGNNSNGINLECFKVIARIRPLNTKEITLVSANKKPNLSKTIVRLDETSVKLYPIDYQLSIGKEEKIFVFDQVFDENDTNEAIFKKTMLMQVENLLNGYNSTILAYGMTGTGKTHTMFGDIYCQNDTREPEPGLILLTVKDIFWKIEIQINENRNLEFKIKLSYLEIYNEQVKDLLVDNSENLMILEDQFKGVVIPDLTEIQLNNPSEIIKLIDQGNGRRTMASTSSNQFSSRSHAILILSIEKRNLLEPNQIIYAKFCLVDLAGSERALISDVKGIRMTEGANINKSLLALGNCINILSDANKKGAFVPYRDSKLTRLLKESLGGNTKTIMIACLSPCNWSYEETLNTLKYASRAKNIKRKVNKNIREIEDVTEYKGIIEALKTEIDSLKDQLLQKNKNVNNNSEVSEEESLRQSKRNDMKQSENNPNLLGDKIEGISQKIMSNLEENWEIKQSVLELKNLRFSNETILDEKKKRLEVLKTENPIFLNIDLHDYQKPLYYNSSMGPSTRGSIQIEALERDIKALEETMRNNDKILAAMEAQMMKTREKRDRLHDDMLKIHENNNDKLVIDLKSACEILNKEKLDLQSQNINLKKKEEHMVKVQEEKDSTIKEMQRTIELMKKKLDEKDKIIEENNIIIKNLSNNNLELIKSSLLKNKNYRSNTAENKINVKFQEKPSQWRRVEGKVDDFPKTTAGIRQYFKGKSAGNFQTTVRPTYQKSKDYQSNKVNTGTTDSECGGMVSNRSNFDNKVKKNLDKLSECSSLTRFEAGNTDIYKNSLILPTEESSPIRQNKVEAFEDVECTKKIVDNLSEVSSILQEDSQNFSVSDQIMFENLDKNQPNGKNYNPKKTEIQHPIENFQQIFSPIQKTVNEKNAPSQNFKKKIQEEVMEQQQFSELKATPNEDLRNEIRNNKMFENPFKSINSNSQSTFFADAEYRLYYFKDRIQKAFSRFRQNRAEKDLPKDILDLILDSNKTPLNLDQYHHNMFLELKDFYYSTVPKGSELSRSFLEKNRSSSANSVTDRKDPASKGNIKVFSNKAVNLPSNGSFIRTYTEKGFYESVDKNKKTQPFLYIKYGSINLQDAPVNTNEKGLVPGGVNQKNDSTHTNKSEEKSAIPWDELLRKPRETKESPEVQNLISKQREHLREEYTKLEEQKNIYKGVSSPTNFKNNFKGDYKEFSDNFRKVGGRK